MKSRWILNLAALTISLTACQTEPSQAPAPEEATARVATTTIGKIKAIAPEHLPASIRTYIREHYTDATINESGQGPRGKYGVLIKQNDTEKGLFFNADGSFNAEHSLKHKSLDASALPALASTYLRQHYPNATIKRVMQGPRGNYGVVVKTNDEYQVLAFGKNGAFLRQLNGASSGKVVEVAELPATVTTYINDNYAGATIQHAGQGPRGNYGVVIETEGERKVLIFNQTGAFLREISR